MIEYWPRFGGCVSSFSTGTIGAAQKNTTAAGQAGGLIYEGVVETHRFANPQVLRILNLR